MAARPIFVVGSLNIDLVTVTERIPSAGETLESISFDSGYGGKGANQAVAAARMLSPDVLQATPGLVRMIGAVADDKFGTDFKEHLEHGEGINTEFVTVKHGLRTGTSVIIVEKQSGENRILFSPGANAAITGEDVNLDGIEKTESKAIVVLQHEIPLHIVADTLKLADDRGFEVILNPAPAAKLSDELLSHVRHLIMNESETSFLCSIPEDRLPSQLCEAASYFLNRGVGSVIITLGSKGVFYASKDNINAGGVRIEAHEVIVKDTTAAGDTFVGAFAAHLSQHHDGDVETALRFANKAASLSVQREGAQSSIPTLADMSGFL